MILMQGLFLAAALAFMAVVAAGLAAKFTVHSDLAPGL